MKKSRSAKRTIAPKKAKSKPSEEDEIRRLATVMHDCGLTEIEVERKGTRIRLRSDADPVAVASAPGLVQPTASAGQVAEIPIDDGVYITSPFVGTFYRSPSPEVEPFVSAGQQIKKGQVLCIVEAMKLMNEIEAEADGKILEVLASNGDAVEYGEPLYRIEPA